MIPEKNAIEQNPPTGAKFNWIKSRAADERWSPRILTGKTRKISVGASGRVWDYCLLFFLYFILSLIIHAYK